MDHPRETGEFRSLWRMTWDYSGLLVRLSSLLPVHSSARRRSMPVSVRYFVFGIFPRLQFLCPWIISFVPLCDLVLLRYPFPSCFACIFSPMTLLLFPFVFASGARVLLRSVFSTTIFSTFPTYLYCVY